MTPEMQALLENSILAETEAINNPTPDTEAKADRLWEQLGLIWKLEEIPESTEAVDALAEPRNNPDADPYQARKAFGKLLRTLRERTLVNGEPLSQFEAAQHLGYARAFEISLWEQGRMLRHLTVVENIAALYSCSPDERDMLARIFEAALEEELAFVDRMTIIWEQEEIPESTEAVDALAEPRNNPDADPYQARKAFGKLLRTLRERTLVNGKTLSQFEAAQRVGYANEIKISSWERGEVRGDVILAITIKKIDRLYPCSPADKENLMIAFRAARDEAYGIYQPNTIRVSKQEMQRKEEQGDTTKPEKH